MAKKSLSSRLFLGGKREETELTQRKLVRNNGLLLAALLIAFFIPRGPNVSRFVQILSLVTISGVVYLSSISLAFARRIKNIVYPFSGITILFVWTAFFMDNDVVKIISYFLPILYFFIIGFAMIVHLIGEKKVTVSTLLNAINTYLFLGYIFSFVFLLAEIVHRLILGSTNFLVKFPEGITPTLQHYLYFSFVTLTTLGYGDFTPVTGFSQMLSVLIAVTGQVYMAMLLAFLVGRFISQQKTEE